MNKKGILFLPVFAVLVFILLTGMFVLFNLYEKKIQEKIGFGDLQYDLYNTYSEAEKESFYYEKKIEYAILITDSFFKQYGGFKPECEYLNYNALCEPDYSDYYLGLFIENIKDLEYKDLKLEDNRIIIILDKEYKKSGKDYEFTYKKELSFKKKISIDINSLNNLKDNIKACLQDNDQSQACLKYTKKDNNILTYEIETDQNLYDNSPLIFKLDLTDTGITTSLLS